MAQLEENSFIYTVHEVLVFCDRSGKLDICNYPEGCDRACVLIANYEPAPGRACRVRVPFTGKLDKSILRQSCYSDGKGGVLVWQRSQKEFFTEVGNARDLGFILAINAERAEVEIFVRDRHGYF